MDNDWTRKAAREAADQKVTEARALILEARSIYDANAYHYARDSADEALLYLNDVTD